MEETTHFGYQSVLPEEKTNKVKDVFDTVASNYDVMNDLMSLGLHRIWKHFAVAISGVRPGDKVLDLATGTADVAKRLHTRLKGQGHLIASDINNEMLSRGRARMQDAGCIGNVDYVQINAESLPFADEHFDFVSIAFGLRNVTDKQKALSAMHRVLKPGGCLLILEFSKPASQCLSQVYDWYSFNILPKVGGWVAKSEDSYRYLAESIRMHPDQETLKGMLSEAGFDKVSYQNLCGGIVALHKAYKF